MSLPIDPALSPYQMPAAQLQWRADGAPFSAEFDDIYFSRDDGLAETDYVFLQQNHLAERWRALDPQQAGVFVIGETGFGSGLNFLRAWQLWRHCAPTNWRLHVISVEKFPLETAQLARALQQWPQLATLSAQLLEQYPPRVPGQHHLALSDNVVLQLLFGDAATELDALLDSAVPTLLNGFFVDAWFLDGFAPAKNPAMWSDELFDRIGRLSKIGTSFATFTVAGTVKRGLQNAGFRIEKIAGFGSKRQMLRGDFSAAAPITPAQPSQKYRAVEYWAYPPPAAAGQTTIVIGGGLAGTSTARALAERGWPVVLLEQHGALASGASGNPWGVLYTKLSAQGGTLNRFALTSYLFALNFYRRLLRDEIDKVNAIEKADASHFCGVLQLIDDTQWQLLRQAFAGHEQWVQFVDAQRAEELAHCAIGQQALWFPRAGMLAPATICHTLAQHPSIDVQLNSRVSALEKTDHGWRVRTDRGDWCAAHVIIANANDASRLSPTHHLPLKAIRGQTTRLPPSWLQQTPRTVICHAGYLAPTTSGVDIGATFDLRDSDPTLRPTDHQRNVQLLTAALPQLLKLPLPAATAYRELPGRVGFRCTTPDYLPMVGAVADAAAMTQRCGALAHNANARLHAPGAYLPGLYVNVGHGSRGLTSTPLCAELIASLITGEARPLPRDLVQALAAARFLVRDIIRGRPAALAPTEPSMAIDTSVDNAPR